jgi:cell division protein FtsL
LIRLNSASALFIVIFLFILAVILFLPKIYFANNIYYTSKDINKLYAHYISLQEENKFLSQQLEDMKFKNQIIDSLLFNPMVQIEQKIDKNSLEE